MAKVGSWETDLSNLKVTWSAEIYHIFEIKPEEFTENHPGFLEFVHQDDREKVNAAFIESLEKQTISAIEHRIITPAGKIKIVEERWQIYRDEKGLPIKAMGTCQDITERKMADKHIKESEHRFRTLFEQNLAGIYRSTKDGIILNCNNAFAKMLKYDSTEELINTHASGLYFSTEDRNNFIKNVIEQEKLYNYESVLKCKDGSPLYFLENISLGKDDVTGQEYFDGILIDITEKTQAVQNVLLREQRFRALVQNGSDLIDIIDNEGKYVHAGGSIEKVTGYQPASLSDKTPFSFIHPDDLERIKKDLSDILMLTNLQVAPYRYRHADGEWRWMESTLRNCMDDKAVNGIIVNSRDVTEKKGRR